MDEKDQVVALREEIKRLRQVIAHLGPDLESLLKQRGFTVYKKEPADDLVLPGTRHVDSFYKLMKKYSFRLFLRDVIKNQESFILHDVTRYTTPEVAADYLKYLVAGGLVEQIGPERFRLAKRPIRSFGVTLEWFLAELYKREFNTQAIWGVKFKRPGVGGDYDLIVKIDGSILYMEVKSSPPKQIYDREIDAFLDRVVDLNPAVGIFFMDTELRMKDKIVPMFEEALKKRDTSPPAVKRMVKELFHIADRIFILNAQGGIAGNIEKALAWYFRQKG